MKKLSLTKLTSSNAATFAQKAVLDGLLEKCPTMSQVSLVIEKCTAQSYSRLVSRPHTALFSAILVVLRFQPKLWDSFLTMETWKPEGPKPGTPSKHWAVWLKFGG